MNKKLSGQNCMTLLISFFLLAPLLQAIDFTWSEGEVNVTYRFIPATGTLHDLEVLTSSGLTFRPCRYGGITSFFLGGRLFYSWENAHQSELINAFLDNSGVFSALFRWRANNEDLAFWLRLHLAGKTLIIEAEAPSSEAVFTFSPDRSEGTPEPKIIELPFGHPVLFSSGFFISAILDPFFLFT